MDVLGRASLPAIYAHLPGWTWALLAGAAAAWSIRRMLRGASRARHHAYLRSREWRGRRQAALARARWRCEDCGHSERLQVHRLTRRRRGHADEDLRVLCPRCRAGRARRTSGYAA